MPNLIGGVSGGLLDDSAVLDSGNFPVLSEQSVERDLRPVSQPTLEEALSGDAPVDIRPSISNTFVPLRDRQTAFIDKILGDDTRQSFAESKKIVEIAEVFLPPLGIANLLHDAGAEHAKGVLRDSSFDKNFGTGLLAMALIPGAPAAKKGLTAAANKLNKAISDSVDDLVRFGEKKFSSKAEEQEFKKGVIKTTQKRLVIQDSTNAALFSDIAKGDKHFDDATQIIQDLDQDDIFGLADISRLDDSLPKFSDEVFAQANELVDTLELFSGDIDKSLAAPNISATTKHLLRNLKGEAEKPSTGLLSRQVDDIIKRIEEKPVGPPINVIPPNTTLEQASTGTTTPFSSMRSVEKRLVDIIDDVAEGKIGAPGSTKSAFTVFEDKLDTVELLREDITARLIESNTIDDAIRAVDPTDPRSLTQEGTRILKQLKDEGVTDVSRIRSADTSVRSKFQKSLDTFKKGDRKGFMAVVDPLDGEVVHTVSYDKAKAQDFHHTEFLPPNMAMDVDNEKLVLAWFDTGLNRFRNLQGNLPTKLDQQVKKQLDIISKKKP